MTLLPRTARACHRSCTIGLVLLLVGSGGQPACAGPLYTITNLGTLPGTNSSVATAISANGLVAGISYNSSDGHFNGAGVNPPGFEYSYGYQPSPSDVVPQSFLYNAGQMSPVNSFGGLALSVNNSGQVVGGAYLGINNSGQYVGAGQGTLNANGTSGPVTGTPIDARAINDAGVLAGTIGALPPSGEYVSHAAVSMNGQVTDLSKGEVDPSYNAQAIAIDQHGDVIITVGNPVPFEAFVYLASTGTTTVVSPLSVALNDKGQVVTTDGMLYSIAPWGSGTPQSLLSLIPANSGWTSLSATAINDAGQIVGSGVIDGQTRAFLMTPDGVNAPEPGALAIWGMMGIVAGYYLLRYRR
jgi:probable HAF family extracellular repeat protein